MAIRRFNRDVVDRTASCRQGERVHSLRVSIYLHGNRPPRLEFAATATPQQVGFSERDGRTLEERTRCRIRYEGFPYSMWGILILSAAYLTNLSPHSALKGKIPYMMPYRKEPNCSMLRTIGARALVHAEIYLPKVEPEVCEEKLLGYSHDNVDYMVYNP